MQRRFFALGAELAHTIKNKSSGKSTELVVGVVDSIPKLVAYRTLAPSLDLKDDIKIVCVEGDLESLLAEFICAPCWLSTLRQTSTYWA